MIIKILSLGLQQFGKIQSTIFLSLCFALLGLSGCGQTTQPMASPAADQVNSYFGGPFNVPGSGLGKTSSTFDHTAKQIALSAFKSTATAQVPTLVMKGTFASADTGFLNVTENFATTGSGVLIAENPPITGAWAVEIPGAGVLANFLSLHSAGSGVSANAAPVAMAENTACPNFSSQTPFLYVAVPRQALTGDTVDYGGVNISVQGSAVTFNAKPFLIGPVAQAVSTVTGGCSSTNLGALTAYPLNSFGTPSNLELVSMGEAGLFVSNFSSGSTNNLGAFGGRAGVIGVAEPSAPVDVSAVVGAKYNGFVYAPLNTVPETYDITALASAFGDDPATSQACSALQSSLMANNGQGAKTVPVLPSANSLYGGEFLTITGAGAVNDPSGASGSENCDVAIDLGTQDSANNGLFPNATVFIGSNYPPFSTANPWICPHLGSACAVSFPAAAIVAKVKGQYVIFLVGSAVSSPAAQLPDNSGLAQAQPLGIYLFQKAQ
jgi:hypothetical protein